MLRRLIALAVALTLLTAPACSDDDNEDAADTTTSSIEGSEASEASEVTMKDFSFDPEAVEVPTAGATLRLVNDGTAAHTFTVDALNIDQEVAAGSQVEVPVKAPESEVAYYCRFHRAQGMEGTLRAKA